MVSLGFMVFFTLGMTGHAFCESGSDSCAQDGYDSSALLQKVASIALSKYPMQSALKVSDAMGQSGASHKASTIESSEWSKEQRSKGGKEQPHLDSLYMGGHDCMSHLNQDASYYVWVTGSEWCNANDANEYRKCAWETQYLDELMAQSAQPSRMCIVPWGNASTLLPRLFDHLKTSARPLILIATTFPSGEVTLVNLADSLTKSQTQAQVLIHLSDEFLEQDVQKYSQIVAHDGLVLRQYRVSQKQLPEGIQVRHIPLGYGYRFPVIADSCSAAMQNSQRRSSRKYTWSWVGHTHEHEHSKTDRREMLDTLSSYDLGPFLQRSCNASAMYSLYADSMFVPIGRGHTNLDCFRIYEAVIAGAVPVIVGDAGEISRTFGNPTDMPIVFANTWADAAERMKQLVAAPIRWQNLSRQLGPWYCAWMASIKSEVGEVLSRTGYNASTH